ncbi:MAG: hypothetical protein M3360_10170 [Actinomycetota bacterium]|nr:hypothetical protein [Actinomycetota bacterium]
MRALVVGGADIRGSLTAVRALARAGWTVGVGSPRPGLANYSNLCTRWHFVPSPKDSLAAFIDAVNSAGEQDRYGLVFGGGDDEVLALSGARRELKMTVPYASHANVLRALDKLKLHEAARRVGMATPRTREANPGLSETVEATVVVKPNIHWTPGSEAGTSRFAAVVTNQRDTVQRRSREILDAGRTPLIQEFIPGRLLAFVAIADRHGNMLTGFSQITDRVWPVGAGMFTRATIIPTDDQLWDQASALLKELRWFGVAQLQFQCTDEGERYLLDFNGRFYWSLALAVNAGLNLPAMWASLATDQAVGDIPPLPIGTRYQWLGGDLHRAFTERRGGLLHDLGDTLNFARSATHSLWDREDVRPSLHLLPQKSGRMAREAMRRLANRSVDPPESVTAAGQQDAEAVRPAATR